MPKRDSRHLGFSVTKIKSNEHSVTRGSFFLFGSFCPVLNTIMSPVLRSLNHPSLYPSKWLSNPKAYVDKTFLLVLSSIQLL